MGAARRPPFKDGSNPFDPQIKQGLAAGITSFLAGSAGSGKTPTGTNAIAKLAYGDVEGMVLQENTVAGINVPLSLADFGKFKTGKSCLYLDNLDDVDQKTLRELVKQSAEYVAATNA